MINHHQGPVSSCQSPGLVLWLAGQSSIYRGQDWAMSLGQPSIRQHQHLRNSSTWSTHFDFKIFLWPAPNDKIRATSTRLWDRCFFFLSKGTVYDYNAVYPMQAYYPWALLSRCWLLSVISTRVEICKELNIIVSFYNCHHGQFVKHPHALLSF